ncbi:phage holin [Mycetocola reblochoni]|uniref:phage holin n=1 Tax=Mycetocola reblochoni TaxID=331618 RepID=UPI003F96DBD5
MSTIVTFLTAEATRAWLYRLLTAVGAVFIYRGVVSAEEAAMWAGVCLALFGLPALNTSAKVTKPETDEHSLE